MPFHRQYFVSFVSWLLVPLMALGSLRGEYRWCVHNHSGAASGASEGSHSHASGHGAGHQGPAESSQADADHGHQQSERGSKHPKQGSACCPAGQCECVELLGSGERATTPTNSVVRKIFPGSLSLVPHLGTTYGASPTRRARTAIARRQLDGAICPSLFLLNCVFLC